MQNNIYNILINTFGIILEIFKNKGSEVTEKDTQLKDDLRS
jgi:hypothetical protein